MGSIIKRFFLVRHLPDEQRCTPILCEEGRVQLYESMSGAWVAASNIGNPTKPDDIYVRELALEDEIKMSLNISEFVKLAQVPFPYDIPPLSMMESLAVAYAPLQRRIKRLK